MWAHLKFTSAEDASFCGKFTRSRRLVTCEKLLYKVAFQMLHAVFLLFICSRCYCWKTISFCFSWIIIFVKLLLMNYGNCVCVGVF